MERVPSLPDDLLELGRRLIPRPVFLVGCARSGTSIYGEAIAAHPDVAYLFEVSRIWNVAIPDREDHRLTAEDATPEIAKRLYEELAEAASDLGGGVVLEKNPKHVLRVSFLDALFPWARFLHIIRDGRDAVASLMFRNRGASWGHLEIPGWQDLLARYPEAHHIRCAHQWRDAVMAARDEGRALGPDRYLEVRYEDLVRVPRDVVTRSLEFMGLGVTEEVDAFLSRIQDETAGSYHARKQVRHYVENHQRRIGRFRENLSEPQQTEVLEVCGDLLRDLGYET